MITKAQQIFEYLLAVKSMSSPPVRDYTEYEYYRNQEEIPAGEGCFLFGKSQNQMAWLEVHKQTIEFAHLPDKSITAWIKTDYNIESIRPEVYKERKINDNIETFTSDNERVSLYKKWLVLWQKWSEETKRKRAIQDLYQFYLL